jgi:transcriptional regulator with XRE-family HTH domain
MRRILLGDMSTILRRQDSSDDPARPNVLAHFSTNVRSLRRARGLSQDALAVRAGLSRRMIVSIESDRANASLSTVDRLGAALGASFSELVRAPGAPDSGRIQSLAWRGMHPDSQAVLLGAAPANREAELWMWSLGEGERYPSEVDSGNWYEMLLVIEGTLTVESTAGIQSIAAGDFLVFSSREPYAFVNRSEGLVRFVRNVVL